MHRTSESPAEPAGAAHQLRHHPVQRRALGDRMTVRAVAAVDTVVVSQLAADARRHALAADAQVDQAVHLQGALELRHPLLEAADPPHRPQQRGRRCRVKPCGHSRSRTLCGDRRGSEDLAHSPGDLLLVGQHECLRCADTHVVVKIVLDVVLELRRQTGMLDDCVPFAIVA